MIKRSPLSLGILIGFCSIFLACSRKGNDPLLDTADPSVTGIETTIQSVNDSDLKNLSITFSVATDLGAPVTGLKLGNLTLKEGWDYTGNFDPFLSYVIPGTEFIVYYPINGAGPDALGIPEKLTENISVPGQYELTFRPRSLKGYFVVIRDLEGKKIPSYQMVWMTVVYGNATTLSVLGYPTR